MAVFSYKCPVHGDFSVIAERGARRAPCRECGSESPRILKSSPMRVVEVLDNGMMQKSLERLVDIEDLLQERRDNHEKKISGD